MKPANGYELIERKDISNLSVLKQKAIYSDEFAELSKEEQTQIYNYCLTHANLGACRENLKQIRYAVSKIYFGF